MASKSSQSGKAATAPKWSLLESEIWSPAQAGDKVEGNLGTPQMGPFGEQHTVTTSSGTTVLPHLTALSDLSRVPIGQPVRITYKGETMNKAKTATYKAFTIEVGA